MVLRLFICLSCIFLVECVPPPLPSGILFLETFEDESIFESGRWIKSEVPRYADQPIEVKRARTPVPGFENDAALEMTKELHFYGVGTLFEKAITNPDKDLVLQYETKFQDVLTCGGAYLKFLRATDDLDLKNLDNATPYVVMFGPDKCGTENKVHFILNHQNPITKAYEEKHFSNPPHAKVDTKYHLYTLHIKANNDFELFIDKKSVRKGSLLKDMNPPVNPPSEIDDPSDHKPSDWVDAEKIPDDSAVKPEDWDESQPSMVEDAADTKPAGWLDDAPETIPDPEAVKPADWDDEEVGNVAYHLPWNLRRFNSPSDCFSVSVLLCSDSFFHRWSTV